MNNNQISRVQWNVTVGQNRVNGESKLDQLGITSGAAQIPYPAGRIGAIQEDQSLNEAQRNERIRQVVAEWQTQQAQAASTAGGDQGTRIRNAVATLLTEQTGTNVGSDSLAIEVMTVRQTGEQFYQITNSSKFGL